MRKNSESEIVSIMREQYETRIAKVLIETEFKEREIMNAAQLTVTRSRDSKDGKKGESYTIHSVEKRDGRVIVKLIAPEDVIAPVPGQPTAASQPSLEYELEDFAANFEV